MLFLWASLFAFIFAAVTAAVAELIFSKEPFFEKRAIRSIFLFTFATTYIRVYFSESFYHSFFIFIFFILLFFIAKHKYKKDAKSSVMGIAVILILSFIGDIAALFANHYLFGFDRVCHWTEPMFLPPMIVSNFSQLLLAYILNIVMSRRENKNITESNSMHGAPQSSMQKSYLIIAALLVLETALFGWMIFSSRMGDIYIMTLYPSLGVLLIMSFLLLYLLYGAVTEEEDRRMRKLLYSLKKHDQEAFELYKQIEQEYLRLHRIRHDLNNQLYAASILAKNNEQDKAERLFAEIENAIGGIKISQKEEKQHDCKD